jgi:hypothetical protein
MHGTEFERGVENQQLKTSNILGKSGGSFFVSEGSANGYSYEMLGISLHACTEHNSSVRRIQHRGAKWHLKLWFSETPQFVVAFVG